MGTYKPWSFSKIKAFKQCPKQFYHVTVLNQFPFKETDATLYGTHFHEAAEFYIGKGEPLPERFNYAKNMLDSLAAMNGEKLCEYEFGLTEDLEPCGFKDPDVWWRGIADLVILDKESGVAKVIDYKSGKNARYADKGQLELMALATFKHFPEVHTVKAGLLFVVANAFIKDVYRKEDERRLWQKWLTEYSTMEKAFQNDVWNPIPSGLCKRHCPVTECPHNGMN
jgi:RecB family exonuclease